MCGKCNRTCSIPKASADFLTAQFCMCAALATSLNGKGATFNRQRMANFYPFFPAVRCTLISPLEKHGY